MVNKRPETMRAIPEPIRCTTLPCFGQSTFRGWKVSGTSVDGLRCQHCPVPQIRVHDPLARTEGEVSPPVLVSVRSSGATVTNERGLFLCCNFWFRFK
eukprot:2624423-Amphidinium_carterae.1